MNIFEPDKNKLTPEQKVNPVFRPVEISGDALTQTPEQAVEQAQDTVVINRDGFDRIVAECVEEMMSDDKLKEGSGLSLLLIPMLGVSFASKIRDKLFGKQDR